MFPKQVRRSLAPLLALALLLGQWLSYAHSLEHSAALPDKDCALCQDAADLDLFVADPSLLVQLPVWFESREQSLLPDLLRAGVAAPHQRARAPPPGPLAA